MLGLCFLLFVLGCGLAIADHHSLMVLRLMHLIMFSCKCAAGSQTTIFIGSSSTGTNTDWLKKVNEELKHSCFLHSHCLCSWSPVPSLTSHSPPSLTAHSSHSNIQANPTHTTEQAPSMENVCYCTKDTLCPDRGEAASKSQSETCLCAMLPMWWWLRSFVWAVLWWCGMCDYWSVYSQRKPKQGEYSALGHEIPNPVRATRTPRPCAHSLPDHVTMALRERNQNTVCVL